MVTASPVDVANAYLDAGRPHEAVALLGRHLADNPEDVRALCLITLAHVNSGNPTDGVLTGKQAVSLAPDNEWAWRVLALAFSHVGDHSQAKQAAARARELAPDSWRTHLHTANMDLRAGDVTFATRVAAIKAAELAPNEPLTHYTVGNVALAKNDLASAEEAYLRALALDPQLEAARNNLSVVTMRRGGLGKAAAGFIDILADNPASSLARQNVLAAIANTMSRVRFILFAGILGTNLIWNGSRTADAQSPAAGLATQLGMILVVAAVGIAFIVFVVRFALGAGFRVRQIARAAWRFDRAQCWIAAFSLAAYGALVIAAVQPPSSALWSGVAIALYLTLFTINLVRRKGLRKNASR